MRIFETQCSACGSVHEIAGSETLSDGGPYELRCSVCGEEIDPGGAPFIKVCRLLMPAERPALRTAAK